MTEDERSPVLPPPEPRGLNRALERNIRALKAREKAEERRATFDERLAAAITAFAGSMRFVYLHLLIFGSWIVANLGWIPGLPPWDPTFVVLGMIASVEAIFLSTFVLISQNRMAAMADRRADLDLQINLLAEHELTKVVTLVSALAEKAGIAPPVDPRELAELERDVAPEAVLDEIEAAAEDQRG
jgi:uncharacterized membrane protein